MSITHIIYNKVKKKVRATRGVTSLSLPLGGLGVGFLLLLSACSNSEFEYSNNRCYFVFDNAQHNDPTLTSALIASSPGTFCRIFIKGNKRFVFESNRGLKS